MQFELRMPIATEDFWEDLLDLIEGGNVLPIIGQGVTTIGPDDQPLAPWLARRLAGRLASPQQSGQLPLPETPTLNDVICRHLILGGARDVVYTRLFRILRDECPEPGPTLRGLAEIEGFRLWITTAFDPLLVKALNTARHQGRAETRVYAYSPEAETKDLPARKSALSGTTVFHVLGKVSQVGDYVAWEEDMLEFICGLNQHMPVMPNLARDLADEKLRILVLGLSFSDWLVRFFLRVARQSRLSLSNTRVDYLADGPVEVLPPSLVLYFGSVVRSIQVVPCDPRHFVAELSRRWRARHPQGFVPSGGASVPGVDIPKGAIFISYAREDEEAVRRLKAGLESHGCLVWFDRDRLAEGGVNFHHSLEDAVKHHCSLFLSVISRHTESQLEAYFHRERNWAAQRAEAYSDADRHEFYLPVIVDDSNPGSIAREPRAFAGAQRVRLLDGEVSTDFARRVAELQAKHRRTAP